jgi:myo-inositol catabolism protein IolC
MHRLFILPFDHRSTFVKELLGETYPPKANVARKVTALKGIVFEAFLRARKQVAKPEELAILIDEEFGGVIIQTATQTGLHLAISVEKSGQQIFEFEYGEQFGKHLLNVKPTFAKALVHYDLRRADDNKIQRRRLKELSTFCKKNKLGLMVELLTSGRSSKAKQIETTMQEMIASGIRPTVWKVEGLDQSSDWKKLRQLTSAMMIVLGRGESKKIVQNWLRAASESGLVNGFAVGRTVFYRPLQDYLKKKLTRPQTVEQITKNYLAFIKAW